MDAPLLGLVGNDVIDLDDAETRDGSCHARFDARVFAPAEHSALAASTAPERLRWILWAAKEAAYKVAKKRDRATVFSPAHFVTSLTSDAHAVVDDGARRYTVALEVRARLVHAIARDADAAACDANSATLLSGIERIPSAHAGSPSDAARTLVIAALASRLGVAPSTLAVVRDGRIPGIRHHDEPLPVDLSLSHHGRFVAFACTLQGSAASHGRGNATGDTSPAIAEVRP